MRHPSRRRATYPPVSASAAPFWFGVSWTVAVFISIIVMSIQKGLSS